MFAQDEGGEGLVGYADVQVNLKDINDNAPIFPQGVYFGNVTENGTAGSWEIADGGDLDAVAFSYHYICTGYDTVSLFGVCVCEGEGDTENK